MESGGVPHFALRDVLELACEWSSEDWGKDGTWLDEPCKSLKETLNVFLPDDRKQVPKLAAACMASVSKQWRREARRLLFSHCEVTSIEGLRRLSDLILIDRDTMGIDDDTSLLHIIRVLDVKLAFLQDEAPTIDIEVECAQAIRHIVECCNRIHTLQLVLRPIRRQGQFWPLFSFSRLLKDLSGGGSGGEFQSVKRLKLVVISKADSIYAALSFVKKLSWLHVLQLHLEVLPDTVAGFVQAVDDQAGLKHVFDRVHTLSLSTFVRDGQAALDVFSNCRFPKLKALLLHDQDSLLGIDELVCCSNQSLRQIWFKPLSAHQCAILPLCERTEEVGLHYSYRLPVVREGVYPFVVYFGISGTVASHNVGERNLLHQALLVASKKSTFPHLRTVQLIDMSFTADVDTDLECMWILWAAKLAKDNIRLIDEEGEGAEANGLVDVQEVQ